jgi:exonuclease III
MLVSETHFTTKSYFSIPGYSFCHTNHPDEKAHGVTAILIRSTLTYSEQLQYATPELQATIIQVNGQQRSINVTSVYCPPKYNLKAPQFNSFFQTLGPCFVAAGDYN